MERRAKERLIGASILVVLVVLVVPELLSGPKPAAPSVAVLPAPSTPAPEPVRTVTVDLATSKSTPADSDNPPVDSAAPASAPAASAAPEPASAPAVASAPANTAPPAPRGALDPPPAAPTSTHEWAVQLGSFANRTNAENLVHQLKAQGFQVYDSVIGAGAKQRFRVRVGPLSDRGAADRTIAKLKALGHAASVVPPAHSGR